MLAGELVELVRASRLPAPPLSVSCRTAYWDFVLSPDVPLVSVVVASPRAFIAASVDAQSIPPFFMHASVRDELEPSLQTTLSAAVAPGVPVLPLSPAAGTS